MPPHPPPPPHWPVFSLYVSAAHWECVFTPESLYQGLKQLLQKVKDYFGYIKVQCGQNYEDALQHNTTFGFYCIHAANSENVDKRDVIIIYKILVSR